MRPRAWWVAAIVGAASLLPVMLLSRGIVLGVTWVLVAVLAFAATRVGLRLHPPAHRRPHEALSMAAGFLVLGAVFEVHWWATASDSVAVSVAMVFYLISFVCFTLAMSRFVARRVPMGDAEGLIDGALVTIATAAVFYDAITGFGHAGGFSATSSVTLVVLPLLMAATLASIVRVLLTGTHRYLSAWFLLTAALSSVMANILFLTMSSDLGDLRLRPLFLAGYVLLACAVLHPTSARLSEPAPTTGPSLALGHLMVIGVSLAAVPTIMLRSQVANASRVPAAAALLTVCLVVWRIARLLRQRELASEALEHRADREAALSAIGRAAVTSTDPAAFTNEMTRGIDRVLQASCSWTGSDLLDEGSAGRLVVPLGPGLGALEVRFPDNRTADADDARFVRTAGDLAAAAFRRWEVEDQLRHRSLHDHLTGLPNRALVCDRLDRALQRRTRSGTPLAVLFIDLDGFKAVNDTLGHAAGDEVLGEVARRLLAQARPQDVVGRLAGDEFVVVCEGLADETTNVFAHQLLDALSVPFELDLGDTTVGASIGVACAIPGDHPETLLRRADEAMYRAKHAGKGQVTVWSGVTPTAT